MPTPREGRFVRDQANKPLAAFCDLNLFILVGKWAERRYGNRLLTPDNYNSIVGHLGRVEQVYAAAEKAAPTKGPNP